MALKKAFVSKLEQFSNWWERKTKGIILPGFEGLSLYNLWIIYSGGIIKGTFSTRASAIAFSFFMALFPFLLFMLNLIPYINFIDDFQLQFLIFMDSLLPPNTSDFFNDIFDDIANNPRGSLLSLAFLISIFLMTNGVNAIFTGFEFSYHTNANRSIIRQYLVAIGVSLIMSLLLLLTVILAVYLTYAVSDFNELGLGFMDVSPSLVKYFVFILLIYIAVATLYYFGTKEARKARFFSIGASFTTLLIVIFTYLFGLYIENFSTYNELYGSIGALLILMVYIWLNSNILLLGFELNASLIKMKKKIK